MAWPAHYHLEWGGRRGANTDEIWQNGVRLAKKEQDGETVPIGDEPFEADTTLEDYVRDQLAYAVRFWYERETSWIAVDCLLEWVSASWILPSGAPDRARSLRLPYAEPIAGGGILETTHPYQCAVSIEWTSDVRARGPGSRGRIYSPAPCMDVGLGTGVFRLEVRSSMAASASKLLEDLRYGNSPTNDRRFPSIVSPSGGGFRSRIDTVTVDGRVDVLRRRAARQERTRTEHRVDHDLFD